MITKEKILKEETEKVTGCETIYNKSLKGILNAMDVYTEQELLEAKKEINELSKWLGVIVGMYSDADTVLPEELEQLLTKYKK